MSGAGQGHCSPSHFLPSSQNGDETGTWPNNQFDTEMLQAMILASASGKWCQCVWWVGKCGALEVTPTATMDGDWISSCVVFPGLAAGQKDPDSRLKNSRGIGGSGVAGAE